MSLKTLFYCLNKKSVQKILNCTEHCVPESYGYFKTSWTGISPWHSNKVFTFLCILRTRLHFPYIFNYHYQAENVKWVALNNSRKIRKYRVIQWHLKGLYCLTFFVYFGLRWRFPPLPWVCTVLHNDPAAPQDQCGRTSALEVWRAIYSMSHHISKSTTAPRANTSPRLHNFRKFVKYQVILRKNGNWNDSIE